MEGLLVSAGGRALLHSHGPHGLPSSLCRQRTWPLTFTDSASPAGNVVVPKGVRALYETDSVMVWVELGGTTSEVVTDLSPQTPTPEDFCRYPERDLSFFRAASIPAHAAMSPLIVITRIAGCSGAAGGPGAPRVPGARGAGRPSLPLSKPVALRVGRRPLSPCEMPGTADHISGRKVHSTRARMQCASDSRTDTRPISHPEGMGAWSPPSRCGRASGMLSGSAHGSHRASWYAWPRTPKRCRSRWPSSRRSRREP